MYNFSMTNATRFYDKDPDFRAFMTLFERLDDTTKEEVAQDIIINISKFVYKDNDYLINSATRLNDFKRWYDKTPAVHTAIEELKKLDKNKRDEMIASVSDIFFEKGIDL